MQRKIAFPPDYPIKCRKLRAYCCSTDFCNSDEVYREKFLKVLHASSTGKTSAHLWACDTNLTMQIMSLFDVLLEYAIYVCLAI